MEIDENLIVVDGKTIGVFNVYDITGVVRTLTSDESVQKVLLTGANTILEILQNAVDQCLISSFQIAHF